MTKIPVHPEEGKNVAMVEAEGEDSGAEWAALHALGLKNSCSLPTPETPLSELLLFGLAPYGGPRPDQSIVLGVAAELEAKAMFIEGPLAISLEMMARRLRVAVDLSKRMTRAASST